MLWAEDVPVVKDIDEAGNVATITLVAGYYNNIKSLDPTPDSWANNRDN